ncbi:MAG: 2-oxo acid dehydrogenase subunit E2 [Pseudomonadota bacterium]
MTDSAEIRVPDLGDFTDVPVIEIPVSVGDVVEDGDSIIVVESDKATMDIPADRSCRIISIEVSEGDTVRKGSLIATVEAAEEPALNDTDVKAAIESVPDPEPEVDESEVEAEKSTVVSQRVTQASTVYASPSIRRFARVLGVDIERVTATGPAERILREDVEAYVKQALSGNSVQQATASLSAAAELPPWPQVDHEKFGSVERIKLSRIAKISGPSLARNAMIIPHVTNFEKADVTELESFRKKVNAEAGPDDAKITMLSFVVKAVVSALQEFPKFNSSLEGDELVIKQYWNIGVATDTAEGLLVPVIKDADLKGLKDIAAEVRKLADAARSGKLKSDDMQGATFTISSLGGLGGTHFTAIINAPEVALLGIPRSEMQPVWDGTEFQPRLIQPLGLTFDHRVIDGAASAQFLGHLVRTLSDFRRWML